MKIKKILITGANGYIGNCLFHILKAKFSVIGIDKTDNNNKKIHIINMLDKKKLDIIISKIKPDLIIHLAAQSLVDEKINNNKYFKNNIVVTKNLIDIMKKNNIKNIIFSSTASVYKKQKLILKEKSLLKPISTYAKTKLLCEKIIKKEININSVILRFFNVCSALTKPILLGELHNPETHLIPTIVYKAISHLGYGKVLAVVRVALHKLTLMTMILFGQAAMMVV